MSAGRRNTRRLRARQSAILAVLLALTACGQRGPLTLPQPPPSAPTVPAGETGQPQNDEERSSDER